MNNVTAVYMRVSTDGQRLDSQERELASYCKRRGWTTRRVYIDKASGASDSRPALDRMMQDVRTGKVARVVCFKLDRLGRSLAHLALILEELNRLGVPLICTSQGIDTSAENPAGKLQLAVLMAVAEFERGIIRERVNAGLAAAKARGVKLGRPRTLETHRNKVVALKAKGMGIRAIARQLGMAPSSVCAVLKDTL